MERDRRLEDLERELARQDAALAELAEGIAALPSVEVPRRFFEELEAACEVEIDACPATEPGPYGWSGIRA